MLDGNIRFPFILIYRELGFKKSVTRGFITRSEVDAFLSHHEDSIATYTIYAMVN